MLTTLTILSREQGKLYAGGPDVDHIPERLLGDLGIELKTSGTGEAEKPTWPATLARLVALALPSGRMTAHPSR